MKEENRFHTSDVRSWITLLAYGVKKNKRAPRAYHQEIIDYIYDKILSMDREINTTYLYKVIETRLLDWLKKPCNKLKLYYDDIGGYSYESALVSDISPFKERLNEVLELPEGKILYEMFSLGMPTYCNKYGLCNDTAYKLQKSLLKLVKKKLRKD